MSTHGSLALEELRNSVGKGSNLVTDVGDASVGVAGSRTDLQLMGTKIDLEKPTIGLEHQAIIKWYFCFKSLDFSMSINGPYILMSKRPYWGVLKLAW